MTGWALIGTGRQVQNEVAPAVAAARGARLVAVVGTSAAKAELVSDQYPPAYGTDDLALVLNDPDVDALYIGSPNGLHHDHVSAALAAGKHVLCDKPLGVTAAQAAELVALADGADLRLGIVHQLRHHPAHQDARAMVRDGTIGELVSIRVDYGSPNQLSGWRLDRDRAGGGVVFNVGIHLIDLVRFLSGEQVVRVAATAQDDAGSGLDVSVTGLLTLASSASVSLWCSHRASGSARRLVLYGTAGSLVATDTLPLTGTPVASTLTLTTAEGVTSQREYPPTSIMRAQVEAFGQAVADGAEPDPGGMDGLVGVLVAEALLAAASTESSVAVADPASLLSPRSWA